MVDRPHSDITRRPPSGEERDATVERLSMAFATDILPMEEFERRMSDVYRAASSADLVRLTADLPLIRVPASMVEPVAAAQRLPGTAVALSTRISATFSSFERAGELDVPERLEIHALFGSVVLDLRRGRFQPGVTEIVVDTTFGSIEVKLPSHVVAECDGEAILATFTCQSSTGRAATGAPVVYITGRAVLASVEVTAG